MFSTCCFFSWFKYNAYLNERPLHESCSHLWVENTVWIQLVQLPNTIKWGTQLLYTFQQEGNISLQHRYVCSVFYVLVNFQGLTGTLYLLRFVHSIICNFLICSCLTAEWVKLFLRCIMNSGEGLNSEMKCFHSKI